MKCPYAYFCHECDRFPLFCPVYRETWKILFKILLLQLKSKLERFLKNVSKLLEENEN